MNSAGNDAASGSSRPTVLSVPGLRSSPIWELPIIAEKLSSNCEVISHEIMCALEQGKLKPDKIEKSVSSGNWNAYYHMEEGVLNPDFGNHCPRTADLIESLPVFKCSLGYSYISVIGPGTLIASHHGCTNAKLRIQLPLLHCEGSALAVDGVNYHYTQGIPIIFDDSFCHSVCNEGVKPRVVLIIDIWHPDVDPYMTEMMSNYYRPPDHKMENCTRFPPNDEMLIAAHVNCAGQVEYDFIFKAIVVGESGAGKSCFLLRLMDGSYSDGFLTTIGVDFKIRTFDIDEETIKFQLWDIAGPERFRAITQSYYRGAHGVFVIYSIGNRESFRNVNHWYSEASRSVRPGVVIMLLGCKADLTTEDKTLSPHEIGLQDRRREVTYEEGAALAAELNIPFVECSSRTGENVEQAATLMMRLIRSNVELVTSAPVSRAPQVPSSSRGKSCF